MATWLLPPKLACPLKYCVKFSARSLSISVPFSKAQHTRTYTLSEAWSGVNWADLMAAQGAFGTDFYDRSILRPKHRSYYRSGRPVIKIGPMQRRPGQP